MKPYKKELLKGFENRRYELTELKEGESLPWWLEEVWILRGLKSEKLYLHFLTDRHHQSGVKKVSDIVLSTSEMKSYSDNNPTLAELDMRKGIFSEKLAQFWDDLNKIK